MNLVIRRLARLGSILGGALVLLSSCTSAPELASYPRAEIDRPYTLPVNVATWSTVVPVGSYRDNQSSSFVPPVPIPLFWRSSLSKNWSLNWSPLPFSASYQVDQTPQRLLGLTFGSGLGYGSGSVGVVFRPEVLGLYRQKFDATWALEVSPSLESTLYTGGNATTWKAQVAVGPLVQLSPLFAVRARAAVSWGSSEGAAVLSSTLTSPRETRVTLPLSVSTVWSIARQWDLDFSYLYEGIGFANGYVGHTGNVTLVHYW